MRKLKLIFSWPNLVVGVAVAVLTISLWAYFNRPEQEPPWPKRIQGFSFSPAQNDDNPIEQIFPSVKDIDKDLALLEGKVHAIRTYSMEDVYVEIPKLAEKHDINVTLGAWIDANMATNNVEVEKLIQVAKENSNNVVRVIVGNEAILRGDVTAEELIPYLDHVRESLNQPVSTAEPWHVWVKHPELADHVDFLAVHMLPYWEGVHVDVAVDYIVKNIDKLKAMFPDKPIVIAEVGWPSNGRTRHSAVASPSNQAAFLRRFLERAEKEDYVYYVMEAFDQPWKRDTEGAVGAYWGVYDVYRQAKFPFREPIVMIPNWYFLAAISVLIASITLAFLLIDSQTLRTRGRSFLAIIAYTAATVMVWVIYNYVHQYLTISSIIVGILMLLGMIGVIVVILTEAHEWAEALWVKERRRLLKHVALEADKLPMVSIHVPIYNEPPEMVIETINALERLDYPKYEVMIIDNNTKDESVWKPVEEHCRKLGSKFKFFHVDPLPGFKAGALNFAMTHTSKEVEIIGVIDSDYVVDSNWLSELVPQFANQKVAIVQAPQDYRDEKMNAFKAMCYTEYRGFFFIGMITRNERNAIIQHGTMTLVRRSALEEVGGWSEWCITEDAELGLRVFEKGYEALYIPKSYGKGLMPDNLLDYKKQRFRWAYGAMQIIRRHFSKLFGHEKSALTLGQKYHFITGWLPWVADSANLVFNCAALFWSLAMLIWPKEVDPPLVEFSLLPMTLFSFKVGKLLYLYRTRIKAPFTSILGAALAGLSLTNTIAKAVLQGVFIKDKPFFRTPKMTGSRHFIRSLMSAREEILFMVALLLASFQIFRTGMSVTLDMQLWVVVLLVQAIPYAATFIVALISGLPKLPARIFGVTSKVYQEL